jgi:dihydroflavonol-4-reductase
MLGPWDWKPSSGEMLLAVSRGSSWMAPRGYFSVVDVRDVCAGILAAADRGQSGRRYILAGETMSYLEAWRLFADVTGGRRPWCRTGPIIRVITGWVGDIIGLITGEEPGFNTGAIRIANLPRNYSSARARKELDYTTRSVHETVTDAWNWFIEYGYAGRKPCRHSTPAAAPESLARDRRAGIG